MAKHITTSTFYSDKQVEIVDTVSTSCVSRSAARYKWLQAHPLGTSYREMQHFPSSSHCYHHSVVVRDATELAYQPGQSNVRSQYHCTICNKLLQTVPRLMCEMQHNLQ